MTDRPGFLEVGLLWRAGAECLRAAAVCGGVEVVNVIENVKRDKEAKDKQRAAARARRYGARKREAVVLSRGAVARRLAAGCEAQGWPVGSGVACVVRPFSVTAAGAA